MDNIEIANKIWDDYQKGLSYQKKLALKDICETNVDFFEGRQWPKVTERTKNFPRPVSNIIEFIVNSKKSNILSAKIKMQYRPLVYTGDDEAATKGAENLTNFALNVNKELDQEALDDQAMLDGLVKGTYAYHYFWDAEKKTGTARYNGGLNGQIIDPLNIIFANPKEMDEQKQKWIILVGRETVGSVKRKAEKYLTREQLDLIQSDDDSEKNYQAEEQDTDSFVTVLTRYFRKDGEVYYTKSTRNVVVQPATALTPNAKNVNIEMDKEENKLNEDENDLGNSDSPEDGNFNMSLYPIAVGQYKDREKSIYGISEVEQLIPTQKAINFNYAMMLMAGQNTGFPKIAVRPKALNGQKITNKPGEIITDYSPDFNGIKYLTPPSFSAGTMSVIDKLIDMTRKFTGSTEVTSGEVLGANMSGSAIVALQSQAKVPIQDMQKKFWRVHIKIARIWEQFFKAYYSFDVPYTVEGPDGETAGIFNGKEVQNMEFDSTIDVGSGSAYSESMSIALLESMLQMQAITFDEFVDLYPDNAMPFKARLKEMRKKKLLPPQVSEAIASNPQLSQEVMNLLQQATTPAPNNVNESQEALF